MQEKPDLQDETLRVFLQIEYGLRAEKIIFLPLGADLNTVVYRIETRAKTSAFLKLRRGEFNPASVTVPKYLHDQGLKQIIPPLATLSGQLWANLPPYRAILYPYVRGHNAYERKLSAPQWVEFGAALKKFHSAFLPTALTEAIQHEDFSPRWRDTLRSFLARIEQESFSEPVAAEMAVFLKTKSAETLALVERTTQLASQLQAQPLESILCHADIHGWNLLVDARGALYMVDWDTLVFAPKERDLMFIGAGLGDSGRSAQEEQALFYLGYSQTTLNQAALAYYRYERIIQDIAAFCEQIFLSDDGGEDRNLALKYLKSNFLPGGTLERAKQTDLL